MDTDIDPGTAPAAPPPPAPPAPASVPPSANANVTAPPAHLVGEPVFVQLREERETTGTRPRSARSSGSGAHHRYTLRFYLVDNTGALHHCATGIDVGDSHYEYNNETGYPGLHCFNKTDVRRWAAGIIQRSQARAGFQTDVVHDSVPPPGADATDVRQNLPTFVSYSETKELLPDGRHRILWYLMDNKGHNHLAVTGEEKDTRDGHYAYHTESVFDFAAPLEAGNQEVVKLWLEGMIVHPSGAGMAGPLAAHPAGAHRSTAASRSGGDAAAAGLASPPPPPHSRVKANTGSWHSAFETTPASGYYSGAGNTRSGGYRGRGRGRSRSGRGPGRPPGSGHTLRSGAGGVGGSSLHKQALTNVMRRGGRGGRGARIADPDRDARELIAAELRRWTNVEASRREFLRNEALSYVDAELTEDDRTVVTRCLSVLESSTTTRELPPPGQAGTVAQRRNLVAVLGALREILHLRASLSLVAFPGLHLAVASLSDSPQPDVAALAQSVLELWLRAAVSNVAVLADSKYVQDPQHSLDALMNDRELFDPVVTAITHRRLADPEAAAGGVGATPAAAAAGGFSDTAGGFGAGSSAMLQMSTATEMTDALTTGAPRQLDPTDIDDARWEGRGGYSAAEAEAEAETRQGGGGGEEGRSRIKFEGGGNGGASEENGLVSAPSGALVNAPVAMPMDEDGPHILNPFEQHLAEEGVQF
jgi:hypothetical protein